MDSFLRGQERACASPDDEIALFYERSRAGLLSWVGWVCPAYECDQGEVPVHDGRILPGRAGPTMSIVGHAECETCHGSGLATLDNRLACAAWSGHEGATALGHGDLLAPKMQPMRAAAHLATRWGRYASTLVGHAAVSWVWGTRTCEMCAALMHLCGVCASTKDAIDAVAAWLKEPNEANKAACHQLCMPDFAQEPLRIGGPEEDWWRSLLVSVWHSPVQPHPVVVVIDGAVERASRVVEGADREAQAAVSAAVNAALIKWALT